MKTIAVLNKKRPEGLWTHRNKARQKKLQNPILAPSHLWF